jgi:hypothetical protein
LEPKSSANPGQAIKCNKILASSSRNLIKGNYANCEFINKAKHLINYANCRALPSLKIKELINKAKHLPIAGTDNSCEATT